VSAGNKWPVPDMMSPEMAVVVAKSAELAPPATDAAIDLHAMRKAYTTERRYWNEGGPVMARTWDAVIPSKAGDVEVRFHVPRPLTSLPGIVYIHGGGWILGNLDTHDRIMRILADQTGAVVVGIDYSLSPEAKFPRALQQCVSLARHLADHGPEYGIAAGNLAFAGDSAGAQLALASYLYLRDEGGGADHIRALLLYYGLFGLADSMSRRLMGGPWDGLTADDLAYYYDCYLADPADARSPYVDCLGADLAGLPPTFIAAAELDPLRDDSATLAAMLKQYGSAHRHVVYPGVLHAFLHNSRHLPMAMTALTDGAAYYRNVTDPPTN